MQFDLDEAEKNIERLSREMMRLDQSIMGVYDKNEDLELNCMDMQDLHEQQVQKIDKLHHQVSLQFKQIKDLSNQLIDKDSEVENLRLLLHEKEILAEELAMERYRFRVIAESKKRKREQITESVDTHLNGNGGLEGDTMSTNEVRLI